MAAKVVDLTHDTAPEKAWHPIKKAWEKVPPVPIMKEKVLFYEWKMETENEHYKNRFDRRLVDLDVFKKLNQQGEIIKMQIDARELTKDEKFWETEKEIQANAAKYITQLKDINPYDLHKIGTSAYEINMLADSSAPGKKKRGGKGKSKGKKSKEGKKGGGGGGAAVGGKKRKVEDKTANQPKVRRQVLPGLMDEIPEENAPVKDDTDVSDFSDEEDPDGIYDPLYKEKRGGPKFKK